MDVVLAALAVMGASKNPHFVTMLFACKKFYLYINHMLRQYFVFAPDLI